MTAAVYSLLIEQGSTLSLPMVWRDSTGTPVDLTGWTARLQIRTSPQDADIQLELTTENGGITLGTIDGAIVLFADATATAALAWPRAVYDLEMIAPSGAVRRLLRGEAVLSLEVTR